MRIPERGAGRRAVRGLTLIELVMFIVIVGVGLAGILGVLDLTAARSADPVVRKQALAIAESLLEEIERMPFTYCDPDDANAATATSEAACTTAESMTAPGPEAGESRYSTTDPFDNVNDYHGFSMSGITDLAGNAVSGLSAYSASVTVTSGGLGVSPASDVALIAVTVSGPGNESVTLHAYRTRYAPVYLP